MSRFEDEQQPGSQEAEREHEPRLLTRPEGANGGSRRASGQAGRQHRAEGSLNAWSRRLAAERVQRSGRGRPGRWLTVVLIAVALLCVVGLAAIGVLRHSLTASLPLLDGEVRVGGLHAPVTVTRDAQGVPSIAATSLDDLLFAQGYITAGDRLWQMDGIRRHAAGELAAILGPGLVEHDRRQRLLRLRAVADRAVTQLPPEQLQQLEAYAHGVNAWIDSHPGGLPVEFRLLAYRPAPWSPRDSLLVLMAMWEDLSTEFPQKMDREALRAHLAPDLLPDLYPVGSWRDQPPGARGRNLTTPREVEQIPLDPSQAGFHGVPAAKPRELLAVSSALGISDRCAGCRPGSNNWVVSGAHTRSGAPLLANDMHLALAIPDTWYEAALHLDAGAVGSPGAHFDVSGFTLPGVPFVVAGRNAHVAWGITNLTGDTQDLRVEHLRGVGANTEFARADGSWALAGHHPERIRVRGGRDVNLDVLTTIHAVGSELMETPVVSALYPSERRALSLAWTLYDPAALHWPMGEVDAADDGASLVAALATVGGPSLNIVWADTGGHIGYHAVGRIPVRGLPLQHPRTVPSAAPANGPPPPEDDDGAPAGAGGPEARLQLRPRLLRSAFHPVRRRRSPSTVHPESARRGRRAAHRSRSAHARPVAPLQVQDQKVVETPLLPLPQPRDYTVGSPVSPVPVDALDASQEWSGYIPYTDLPSVTDPPDGLIATANARITPDDYPWAVANDWPDAFRVERIVHLLSGRNHLTAEDMLRLQNDVHSDVDRAIAQRLAYGLDHASPRALGTDARRLKQAADMMRDWDGDVRTGSPAAAVVRAVRAVLWPALLVPQIQAHDGAATDAPTAAALARLYTWNEQTTALELLLQNQPARWLPAGSADWSDFLAAVTARGLRAAHAPADLSRWQYGELHTIEIEHPLFGEHPLLSALLGIRGTTGIQPAPGDGTTVKQMGAHFGPSERFTADLSSSRTAFANLTTGESGNPRSRWYLDQFPAWLAGTTFDLPADGASPTHTLRLLPR